MAPAPIAPLQGFEFQSIPVHSGARHSKPQETDAPRKRATQAGDGQKKHLSAEVWMRNDWSLVRSGILKQSYVTIPTCYPSPDFNRFSRTGATFGETLEFLVV